MPEIPIKARIAPTPSGYLHPGNVYNFIITWLETRKAGGSLRLRIDDADSARVRKEYLEDIFFTLDWLKLDYDEGPQNVGDFIANHSQLQRAELYMHTLDHLKQHNLLFACTCSRSHLLLDNTHQHCLQNKQAPNVPYAWRMHTPMLDQILAQAPHATIAQPIHAQVPYPVMQRRDGFAAYTVCSLTDDIHFEINLIVRGYDLLPQTHLQQKIAYILGWHQFVNARFVHHGLLTDNAGQKLSKSAGAQRHRLIETFTSVQQLIGKLPFTFKTTKLPQNLNELLDAYINNLLIFQHE